MRVVVLSLLVSFGAAGCELLDGLFGCDPTLPDCLDETKGHIRGTIEIPEAATSSFGRPPAVAGPAVDALRAALNARAPRTPAWTKRRAIEHKDLADPAKVRVEQFRRGEAIVRPEERGDERALADALAAHLADGTRVDVTSCGPTACLAKLFAVDGKPLDHVATVEAVTRLDAMPGLRYAERNLILQPMRAPNDEFYALQWHYGAIDLEAAWDQTVGSDDVVGCVVDTGILSGHPDLAGRLGASADLIDDPDVGNDGDGRDDDGEDPGDQACGGDCHSYHGTHVAGTMGAATDNGEMVSGVTWNGTLTTARALGKGGGSLFDIQSAIYWCIGADGVDGVSENPQPADVINMSLGGPSDGSDAIDEAIADAVAQGTIVVVAAGNDDADAAGYTPANAPGAIAVASVGNVGGSRVRHQKASYSNFGDVVSVAGPGGEQAEDVDGDGQRDGVLSTLDDYVSFYQGTSMAAPHVAGVAMLMKSVDRTLDPDAARAILEGTANDDIDCDEGCGAGLISAARAVREVQGEGDAPFVVASPASQRVGRGDTDAVVVFKNIGGASTEVTFQTGGAGRGAITLSRDSATLGALDEVSVAVTIDRSGDDTGEASVTAVYGDQSAEARLIWTADVVRASNAVSVGALRVTNKDDGTFSFTVETIVSTGPVEGFEYFLFNLEPGTYIVLGLTDDDGDERFEDNEGVGMYRTFPDADQVEVAAGATVEGVDFTVAPRFGDDDPADDPPAGGGTGEGEIGDACASSGDCGGGLYCETELPNGYCTTDCAGDADCGAGAACYALARDTGDEYQVCLATCGSSADCRTDGSYGCDTDGTCFPL